MFTAKIRQFELFVKLFIFDPRIGKALVIGQKLFPGGRHILVGGKGRDQRAEAEIAHDHQITADGIEEERRDLGDEVVQELDKEFAEIDFLADFKNPAHPLGEMGQLETLRFMGADIGRTGNDFADMFRHAAHILHALFAKLVHAALQFRDQVALQRIKRNCRQPHQRVLNKDKGGDRDQNTALIKRQRKRFAKETAKRFCFGGDHGNDFALAGFTEMRKRKTQNPFKQGIAQPAQKPFGHHADIDVDEIFEPAIDEDQREKDPRQGEQIFDLVQFDAKNIIRFASATDCLVDDQLWQIQRVIQKWKGDHRDQSQDNLLQAAVLPDIGKNRLWHSRVPYSCRNGFFTRSYCSF